MVSVAQCSRAFCCLHQHDRLPQRSIAPKFIAARGVMEDALSATDKCAVGLHGRWHFCLGVSQSTRLAFVPEWV
eukprot:4760461-Amphidinium_carterae.1